MLRSCLQCELDITASHHNAKFCSTACQEKDARAKVIQTRKAAGDVQCQICSEHHLQLAFHLSSLHNVNIEEYKKLYPGAATIAEETSKIYSARLSGQNNHWAKHGGALSVFSKNYSGYSELSEEAKSVAIAQAVSDFIKSTPAEARPMSLQYWINTGLTEDEAKLALADRQRTFSLEICIEKYGKEAGLAKWQARQEKWQDNLNSKTEEEIARIKNIRRTAVSH